MDQIKCPKCGSDFIFVHPGQDDLYLCGKCHHQFIRRKGQFSPEEEALLSGKTDHPMNVFISYGHDFPTIVQEIMDGLKNRGHEVWFDETNIGHGDDWREKITKGIKESNGVLSFLSTRALREKGVCLDELGIAVGVKYGNIRTVLLEPESVLQPIPGQLSHRQWLDMSGWQKRKEEDPEEYQKWFVRNLAAIIRMIESDESREFDGDIHLIREKLSIIDTAISRQGWFLQQPFSGREWLTEKIETWLDDKDGGHLCTVYGGPGTGKSAFAAQYVYHSFRIGASLFFEHDNRHFNSAEAVLRELIFQLACRLPGYRSLLIEKLNNIPTPQSLELQELYESLLAVPLRQALGGDHETLCIVVDGLDECGPEDRRMVAQLLRSEYFPAWLRVLVLTRPETGVTGYLRPDFIIDLSKETESNLADIRTYYQERISEQLAETNDSDYYLDILTKRTAGTFLYAEITADMIRNGKLAVDAPDSYPTDLADSFNLWFGRYFPDREEYDRYYKLPLGIIAACEDPIPLDELEAADGEYNSTEHSYRLRKREDDEKIDSVRVRLERCSLLLKYHVNEFGQNTVSYTHRYIAEWMTGFDEDSGQTASEIYSFDPVIAMWALENAWRQRLEKGQIPSEYAALHLLSTMEKAGEPEDLIRKTAAESSLGQFLDEKREQYSAGRNWKLVVPCFEEYLKYCIYAFGPEDKRTIDAEISLGLALFETGYYQKAEKIWLKVYEISIEKLGEEQSNMFFLEDLLISLSKITQDFPKSLKLTQSGYDAAKEKLGDDHHDTLEAWSRVAAVFSDMGEHQKALEIYRDIYHKRKNILGEKHPDTLDSLCSAAGIHSAMKDHQKAKELYQNVYDARKEELGDKHPDTIASLGKLADEWSALGDHDKALELFNKVYADYRETKGEDDTDTLRALQSIAGELSALEEHQQALDLLEKVYDTHSKAWVEENVIMLTSMIRLAEEYRKTGQHQKALQIYQRLYEVTGRILGEDHPSAIIMMHALAYEHSQLGNHQKASALYQHTYNINRTKLGEEHPDTQRGMIGLAAELSKLGEHQKAEKLYSSVHDMRKNLLGEKHPDTLFVSFKLALEWAALREHQKALESLMQIYDDKCKISGEKHPDTLTVLTEIACSQTALEDFDTALKSLQRVYDAKRETLGEKDPETLKALTNLAYLQAIHGEHKEALESFQKVYDTRRDSLGEQHPETVSLQEEIASEWAKLDEHRKSLALFQKSFDTRKETQGEEHPDTLKALNSLAAQYSALDDHKKASELLQELLEIRRKKSGEDDPDTLLTMAGLAFELLILGDIRKSRELYEEIYRIAIRIFGKDHPLTLQILSNLKSIPPFD